MTFDFLFAILEGEERLRLLNYQNNGIQAIQLQLQKLRKLQKLQKSQKLQKKLQSYNYQNSGIQAISNLHNLPHLIFLDLYNNQIKRISGLEDVPTLRVLMLGKNHLEVIERLEPLRRLEESSRVATLANARDPARGSMIAALHHRACAMCARTLAVSLPLRPRGYAEELSLH